MDTSNRFRVVSNIVCEDFMHSLRPLGAKQVPSRLAAPPRVPWMVTEQRGVSSVTNVNCDLKNDFWILGLKSATLDYRHHVRD